MTTKMVMVMGMVVVKVVVVINVVEVLVVVEILVLRSNKVKLLLRALTRNRQKKTRMLMTQFIWKCQILDRICLINLRSLDGIVILSLKTHHCFSQMVQKEEGISSMFTRGWWRSLDQWSWMMMLWWKWRTLKSVPSVAIFLNVILVIERPKEDVNMCIRFTVMVDYFVL